MRLEEAMDRAETRIGTGCSDGNCAFRPAGRRGGQHTNGGCGCRRDPRVLAVLIDVYLAALEDETLQERRNPL
jgi:hypothetical protein